MASWQAHLLRFCVRHLVGPRLRDMTDIARVRRVFGTSMPAPGGVRYTPDEIAGVRGEWIEADGAGAAPAPLMLYIHGGGFVGCSPRTHRAITAGFARKGFRVFAPDYRLAPEHRFPAALDDVVAVWRELDRRHALRAPGMRRVVAGDSAGGNLTLALLLELRDAGEALPDAAAMLSPAADLTGSSPSLLANQGRDPMFDGQQLGHLANAYLGPDVDPAHPRASPLLGPLDGLPPLLLHVGEDEVLRDDALRMAQKARAAGVRVELTVWPVVPHVWQLSSHLPEGQRSMDAAARFLATARRDEVEFLDAVIVGAGLSGIGAAAQLQARCPGRRYALLETRQALGGTWDLFRYPGVRSDSDMHTLAYAFKPWREPRTMLDGASIRRYIEETAAERGIDRQVRYDHRVKAADWSAADSCWTLDVEHAGVRRRMRCRVLLVCAGYYRYDAGHAPTFTDQALFRGRVVHPQAWPADLDVRGRRVVVVGSGATAVSLVPALAREGAQVTMLQRSPSYVLSLPAADRLAAALQGLAPRALVYRLVRLKNLVGATVFYQAARRWPRQVGGWLIERARQALGPAIDAGTHFTPRYGPWDQRVCFAPDGDLFETLRSGRAEVVTDHIDRFTEQGLRLASGRELAADVVVTATGLALNVLGDIAVSIEGRPCDLSKAVTYKSLMFGGIPNLVFTFGYTNASWTLKADLTATWTCRLLNTMERRGVTVATPEVPADLPTRPFVDLNAGYVQRASALLPRQGLRAPWRVVQNYLRDWWTLRVGRIDDGSLRLATAEQDTPPLVHSPSTVP